MAGVKWIKIVTDVFNNRKIKQIEAMPDADAILVIWFKILCLAGNINDGGFITITKDIPYTEEMLANEFRRPLSTVRLAMNIFERYGMIEVVDDVLKVSNWEKYQSIDRLAELKEYNRLAKQRERQKKRLTANVNDMSMTCQQCQDTDIDIDKDKDIELEKEKEKEKEPEQDLFDRFWAVYPRKVGKRDAVKAWNKLKPDETLTLQIIEGVERWKLSTQWTKDGGQYIPYPATFLNGERWKDECDIAVTKPRRNDLDEFF